MHCSARKSVEEGESGCGGLCGLDLMSTWFGGKFRQCGICDGEADDDVCFGNMQKCDCGVQGWVRCAALRNGCAAYGFLHRTLLVPFETCLCCVGRFSATRSHPFQFPWLELLVSTSFLSVTLSKIERWICNADAFLQTPSLAFFGRSWSVDGFQNRGFRRRRPGG